MIDLINSALGGFVSLFLVPFRGMSPWVGMIVVSVLTALLMLAVYRWTSNQEAIHTIKDRIKAHLLELRLYKDSLPVTLQAQGRILRYNLRYLGHSLRPMLVMIVPLVLILVQLDLWFGYRSLQPGESALLKVHVRDQVQASQLEATLEAPDGVKVDTPAVRIDGEDEVDWRISGAKPGVHELQVRLGSESITKSIAVQQSALSRISPSRSGGNVLDRLLAPGEPGLAGSTQVKGVDVTYPGARLNAFGWHVHWLVAYFVLSIVFGFALKGLFGVEI